MYNIIFTFFPLSFSPPPYFSHCFCNMSIFVFQSFCSILSWPLIASAHLLERLPNPLLFLIFCVIQIKESIDFKTNPLPLSFLFLLPPIKGLAPVGLWNSCCFLYDCRMVVIKLTSDTFSNNSI